MTGLLQKIIATLLGLTSMLGIHRVSLQPHVDYGGISPSQAQLQQDQAIDPYVLDGTMLEATSTGKLIEEGTVETDVMTDKPEIVLNKWDKKESLGITLDDLIATGERTFLSKNVDWNGNNESMEAIPLDPTEDIEDGGMEINVTLASEPISNIFNFSITGSADMNFVYQGPLWQERGLKGPEDDCTDTDCSIPSGHAHRPENVVDSYAVYSTDYRDHIEGQINYGSGKLFHIYRPQVTDAKGNTVWADLSYTNGILTVTVPQKFLDTAVYPVIIDPTFGYTTQGASSDNNNNDIQLFKSVGTPASSGTLTSVSAYVRTDGTGKLAVAIYSNSGTSPSASIANVNTGTTVTTGATFLLTATNLSASVTSGTQYWLGMKSGTNGQSLDYKFDTLGSNNLYFIGTEEAWPATASGGTLFTEQATIFGTYTASGGSNPIYPAVFFQTED